MKPNFAGDKTSDSGVIIFSQNYHEDEASRIIRVQELMKQSSLTEYRVVDPFYVLQNSSCKTWQVVEINFAIIKNSLNN